MNNIIAFLLAILSSMLIDNVVLSRFYGICPFLGVSKKVKSSLGMGVAVVFVIVLATLICWPLYNYVLVPAGIPYLDTVAYILVIASLVQLVGLFIKKFSSFATCVVETYRDIYETIIGKEQDVYRLLPSGGNAGILLKKEKLPLPKALHYLCDIPIMESLVTQPPFIMTTRQNTRKGFFTFYTFQLFSKNKKSRALPGGINTTLSSV